MGIMKHDYICNERVNEPNMAARILHMQDRALELKQATGLYNICNVIRAAIIHYWNAIQQFIKILGESKCRNIKLDLTSFHAESQRTGPMPTIYHFLPVAKAAKQTSIFILCKCEKNFELVRYSPYISAATGEE